MSGLGRGPGVVAEPGVSQPGWGGRRAQQFVALTLATYGDTCWLCGLPGADTADHVVPRSKGGAVYDVLNLAPAHRRCNEARGNRAVTGEEIVEDGRDFFTVE